MFAKLAFRNVRRQMSGYIVYFATVAVTVALMFAVNNAVFSPDVLSYADSHEQAYGAMIALTVFVSLVVACVLGYAASFMLKLRKREFGTYLTLGMTRRNILALFLLENLIICVAALVVGLLIGFVLFQLLSIATSALMEVDFRFAAYSVNGLLLTVGLVVGMFLLSSLLSSVYLKKTRIRELIYADKKVPKARIHPAVWGAVAVVSFAAVLVGIFLCDREFQALVEGLGDENEITLLLFAAIVLFAIGIALLHYALSKCVPYLFMCSKKRRCKGTNMFVMRQMKSRLGSNAALGAVLAFLISFTVLGGNISFIIKATEKIELEIGFPYEIMGVVRADDEEAVPIPRAREIIGDCVELKTEHVFSLYTTGRGDLYKYTELGKYMDDSNERDRFIAESEFNVMMTECGYAPISLGEGELMAVLSAEDESDFEGASVVLGGREYSVVKKETSLPDFCSTYFYCVAPDEALEGMEELEYVYVAETVRSDYDFEGLRKKLTYSIEYEEGGFTIELADFNFRERVKRSSNRTTAIITVGILYVAIVFMFMALAVLALKSLSHCDEDAARYSVLSKLGASRGECKLTFLKESLAVFFLPLPLSLLSSIPVGIICCRVLKAVGLLQAVPVVISGCIAVSAVILSVYLCYFAATHLVAFRRTFKPRRI